MVLRIAGEPEDFDGGPASILVHGEPVALARRLARGVPELAAPIGSEAPVGWRFSAREVPAAVRALEAALSALDPEERSLDAPLQELRRALELFRTAESHARAVTLEV